MTRDPCRTILEALLARRLDGWRGLAQGCRMEDVAHWLAFRAGAGRAFFGSDSVDYEFRALAQPGFASDVFFHSHAGVLELVTTDNWSLNHQACDAVRAALGDPQATFDFPWSGDVLADGAWVWPARGIEIAVVPATRAIVRLAVFPPCSVETYGRRYRKIAPAREFPDTPA